MREVVVAKYEVDVELVDVAQTRGPVERHGDVSRSPCRRDEQRQPLGTRMAVCR